MVQSHWRRKAMRVAILIILPYLMLLLGVACCQRSLIYFPTKLPLDSALTMASRNGLEPWYNGAGQLIGWKQLSKTNAPHLRILITHGNAGSAIDRVDYAASLRQATTCDVYIVEYPGYGPRAGSPSQKSLFQAANEALDLLQKDGPVFVVGESLSTGVAAYLAGTHPEDVAGLLLIAPYDNLGNVAQAHMPFLPVKWILLDKFPSADYLRNYHGPVAVVVGDRDTTIPPRFGRKLYEGYSGRKRSWEVPLASHNDLPNQPAEFWKELVAFWNGS